MKKIPVSKEISSMEDPNLINRVYYELKKPVAEISLLNQEEPIKISEVGGAESGSRLTFVAWTQESAPYYCVEPWMSPPNSPENHLTSYLKIATYAPANPITVQMTKLHKSTTL